LQKSYSNTYRPAEDTFFLADYIKHEQGDTALDIGTGSGYLARILSNNFPLVVATDIDFEPLRLQGTKFENSLCCDAADALDCKFDLIVCNMPYLPSETISDKTVDGGKDGIQIPLKIIESAKKCLKLEGRILFLTSSLANHQKLVEKIKQVGFDCKIVARKKLFFEELIIVQAIARPISNRED
jgi:release factor glutamine methyltransferase